MSIDYFSKGCMAGRVVLITGGGSGIGFEIARQFGLHGARGVVIMGRRQAFIDKAVAVLRAEGVECSGAAGDVRKPADCDAAVKCALDHFGSLDVLVCAAAGNFLAAAQDISANGFRTVLEIDTLGSFNAARAAYASLGESRHGGVITNITANLHWTATWYQSAPVAAKAGIEALSRTLALEWGACAGGPGIRVNCVAPGPIADTPGLQKLAAGQNAVEQLTAHMPVARAGTTQEIASMVMFLCLNGYITGQAIGVDGGSWFASRPPLAREVVAKISRGVEAGSRAMGPGGAQESKL